NDERRKKPHCGVARQQKAGSTEPCEKCRKSNQIEGRDLRSMHAGVGAAGSMRVNSSAVSMQARYMSLRKVQPRASKNKNEHAQKKSDDETDEIEIRPGHSRTPFLAFELAPACGCSASSNRSASPGVSKIAPSSRKHLRVSFSRASLIKMLLSSA